MNRLHEHASAGGILRLYSCTGSRYCRLSDDRGRGWLARVIILTLLFLVGIARAFEFTTLQTLLPSLVSNESLPRALALAGSVRQAAAITGPLLGGLLYRLRSHP